MISGIHPCNHSRGLTLLEVLIAVVVLSIGLLGLAHLQIYGLEATDNSYRRSVASYVAMDLADRMRVNRAATRNGSYDDLDSSSLTPPADPGCVSTGCTATQMAQLDKREWLAHFVDTGVTGWVAALDVGRGQVIRNGDRVRIVVSWKNTGAGWDATKKERTVETRDQTFDFEFDL